MLKKSIALLIALFVAGCNNSSGEVVDDGLDSRFEASEVLNADSNEILECYTTDDANQINDMDSRLKPGQVFVQKASYLDYNSSQITNFRETQTIESVDHDKNNFVSRTDVSGASMTGWFRAKTQFTFSKGFSGSENEFLDASANFTPMIEQAKKEDDEQKSFVNCSIDEVDQSKQNSEVYEKGTYIFSDGRKVSAVRKTIVKSGAIKCLTYEKQLDGTYKSIKEENKNAGKETLVLILTQEVPSIDALCPNSITRLLDNEELVGDDQKVYDLHKQHLVRVQF